MPTDSWPSIESETNPAEKQKQENRHLHTIETVTPLKPSNCDPPVEKRPNPRRDDARPETPAIEVPILLTN